MCPPAEAGDDDDQDGGVWEARCGPRRSSSRGAFRRYVANHADRRLVLITAYAGAALCAGLLAWFSLTGSQSAWPIFAVMTVFGAGRAFWMPAGQSMTPNLVPVEAFPSAVALNSMLFEAGVIGVGATITAIALVISPIERHVGRWMFAGVALFGASTVVFGLSRSFTLSLSALALLGVGDMVSVYVFETVSAVVEDGSVSAQGVGGLAIVPSPWRGWLYRRTVCP